MRIAVIGAGVAGLVAARELDRDHDVTLYEAAPRGGGHAHTVDVDVEGTTVGVDVGFMVFNERNYPILSSLFDELGVESRLSDMSFGVVDPTSDLEWSGGSLLGLLAQPWALRRPRFVSMLAEVVRFNRLTRSATLDPSVTLREFTAANGFSGEFFDWYLVPMGASIWSADPATFLDFPAAACLAFLDNHGLLRLADRPQWRTVIGGSRRYVDAVLASFAGTVHLDAAVCSVVRQRAGVDVVTAASTATFDHVVLACHSDDALALIDAPTETEQVVLSAIRYRSNEAVVHTDPSLVARRRRARASWNWRRTEGSGAPTLTYDLSRLQGHTAATPIYLTLNATDLVDPATVRFTTTFRHPVFDRVALEAQRRWAEINGADRLSFAGAYWGYGFHEDGARSAMAVVDALEASRGAPGP